MKHASACSCTSRASSSTSQRSRENENALAADFARLAQACPEVKAYQDGLAIMAGMRQAAREARGKADAAAKAFAKFQKGDFGGLTSAALSEKLVQLQQEAEQARAAADQQDQGIAIFNRRLAETGPGCILSSSPPT